MLPREICLKKLARPHCRLCKKEQLFGAAAPAAGVGLVTTCSRRKEGGGGGGGRNQLVVGTACAAHALNTRLLPPSPLLICSTYNSQHAICVVFWYCTPHLNVSLSPAGAFGALVEQSCAHPGAEKKAGGGESRLVADFSAQPVGWAELTPITLHNLLRQ